MLRSAFDKIPSDCAIEEFVVETLLYREHSHRANTPPGKLNPTHAFLEGNCTSTIPVPRGLLNLGNSARSVRTLSNAVIQFSMVRRVMTSLPSTYSSSEWIA
jgi:hypothetical protein